MRGARRRSAGLTLVEMMVAIALTLFIVAAMVTLFANSSRAKAELDKTSRQIENGRYAIDLLREDLELAGFYGPLPRGAGMEYTYSEPLPCATDVAALGFATSPPAAQWTLPVAVQGIAPATAAACLPDRKPGTAAIVVRRVDPTHATPPATAVPASSPHLQTSFCYEDTARFVFSDDPTAFTLRRAFNGTDCQGVNYAQRYVQRIYYVASCGRCTPSDGIPTLKRAELVSGTWQVRTLADGIDNLQFEYGFDDPAAPLTAPNPPGTPDRYEASTTSTAPADVWSNVVAVRMFLLTRTVEASPGYVDPAGTQYDLGPAGTLAAFSDGYKRRAYIAQVRVQNIAGARETP